jgi:effector-binding domain-containing protein
MSLHTQGIEYKALPEMRVATMRINLRERKDLPSLLHQLVQQIPAESIQGPPFCLFQFISSVEEGFDVELALPVDQEVRTAEVQTRTIPAMEVLSVVHRGAADKMRESYARLYSYAAEHAIISDEFCREVYLEPDHPEDGAVEVQFVIHDWAGRLNRNLERILGQAAAQEVMRGNDTLTLESTMQERFLWLKGALERLAGLANEEQSYDALSSCAHVFRQEAIEKARAAYEQARSETGDPLQAVDAVLDLMERDPAWAQQPSRKGRTLYTVKSPRDPAAHKAATTDTERRKAYCFCPLVRERLDAGMPPTFCYCGAGWFRQQWEGILGQPVRIDVLKSVLQGDEACSFAIHLPEEL